MNNRISKEAGIPLIVQQISDVPSTDLTKVLDEVMRVEREAWPVEIQASKSKFESRAAVFPQGFITIALPKEGIMGVSTSEIIDYSPQKCPISWEDITDNGWIKKTHKSDGNALYIVSVGVSPRATGKGVGSKLVEEQQKLAQKLNLDYLVLGSRIPGYQKYFEQHPGISVEDYLKIRGDNGRLIDPDISFYTKCGLEVTNIIPNYMDDDPESRNYGVVMVWKNPRR